LLEVVVWTGSDGGLTEACPRDRVLLSNISELSTFLC
jgi:hypothetical protein